MPALKNIQFLASSPLFAGLDTRAIFRDVSMPTALERADGNWESVVLGFGGPRMGATVDELAEMFDLHIAPSRVVPKTRSGHWRNWSLVVTFWKQRARAILRAVIFAFVYRMMRRNFI
jgi:hypothetical protein